MELNKRIRLYIEENGIKFTHVAEKSDIDIKKFSRFMGCKQRMYTDEYEKICRRGLSLNPGYFFDEKFLETKNKPA